MSEWQQFRLIEEAMLNGSTITIARGRKQNDPRLLYIVLIQDSEGSSVEFVASEALSHCLLLIEYSINHRV